MITVDRYTKQAIEKRTARCAACGKGTRTTGRSIPDVATHRIGFAGSHQTQYVDVCSSHFARLGQLIGEDQQRAAEGLPVEVEVYHPGTPREDGRGIDAPPNTVHQAVLPGVRVHIDLYRDGGVRVTLVDETKGMEYALAEAVRAALEVTA